MKTNSLIIKFVSNVISPLLALAAFSTQSSAAIAYAYTGPTAGNQNFTGALGLDFDVLSSIQITEVMAFDDDADGWSTGSNISVVIYDRDTQLSITPNYNFSIAQPGALAAGSYRSQILSTPITLSAGGRYSIVAWGFNANDQLYNSTVSGVGAPSTDDGGGLISFTGLARNSATTNAYPARPDTGPANRYGSASFAFQAVPEPTGVMLLSLGSLLMLRRRRNP